MELSEQVLHYIKNSEEELMSLLKDLAVIPAPSHHEDQRAAFCKQWLEENGAEGVYIDEAKNVIFPIGCKDCSKITVFMAHTDVVFPDTTPLPLVCEEDRICAPGIGDDTVAVVMMLMTVKYILQNKLTPKHGILFVANSCEEGLGNLKGSRQIMKDFEGRIAEFYTFDGQYLAVVDKCVGSYRYEIECETEGGHSFGAFGNANAIVELSHLISDLYTIEIPKNGNSKTTYNVGRIEGGTSVNTIAQYAKMLYEYRSDDVKCIQQMTSLFEDAITRARERSNATFRVTTVGIRPCGSEDLDRELHEKMLSLVSDITKKHTGIAPQRRSGSTDCNSAMSVGIPAVCVGCYSGGGAHTREEYLELDSIPVGMRIVAELILSCF